MKLNQKLKINPVKKYMDLLQKPKVFDSKHKSSYTRKIKFRKEWEQNG